MNNTYKIQDEIKFLETEPYLPQPDRKTKVGKFIGELVENANKWGIYGVFGKERSEMMNCSSRKHYLKMRYPEVEWAMTKDENENYILIGRFQPEPF
jgi:hypothetical protein